MKLNVFEWVPPTRLLGGFGPITTTRCGWTSRASWDYELNSLPRRLTANRLAKSVVSQLQPRTGVSDVSKQQPPFDI
ncbi:hypothetical protein GGD46_005548 [Rhizobium lusitanum]|uniref:Uncharacterized protein n=1 Tax=Rhizobium lusitanum TaxID=293958 RepID=A0A1C3XBB0_9HYPH|nr:hypothetical protein [Rhizobium lusitanum]SCB49501.1 hypothetical protein GA0061101_13062 [Rhizobium lusitanum]